MTMNDFIGKTLEVGDEVVFTEYNRHGLSRGVVVGFSKGLNMAVVEYTRLSGVVSKTKKTSDYLVKVS